MSEYLLELKSVQSSNIRILFEVMKEVIKSELNLIFTPEGIKLTEMDGLKVCVIHLSLDSSAFEVYNCPKRIVVGVNSVNFHKIIKIVGNNDTISFFIKTDTPNLFTVRFDNSQKNKIFESVIDMLDIPHTQEVIPDIDFESVIVLPTSDFQKICKDIHSLGKSDRVEIQCHGDQLIFKHQGYFSEQQILLGKNDSTNISTDNDKIIQGVFNLKYLLLFSKATNLCTDMKIYLKNDFPMILEYSVGSLGNLRFIIGPLQS
jgi:proliferating cell nuclear antigen